MLVQAASNLIVCLHNKSRKMILNERRRSRNSSRKCLHLQTLCRARDSDTFFIPSFSLFKGNKIAFIACDDCFNEAREKSPADPFTREFVIFMFSHFTFRRPQFPKNKTCWMSCGRALNAFGWGNSTVSLRFTNGEVMMRAIT